MSKIVEMKARGVRADLRKAWQEGTLVRIWRAGLEPGAFSGYVTHLGPEFFMIWSVGDYIGFDGFYALRYRDVSNLEAPDSNQTFLVKAMALKGLNPDWPKEFALDDIAQIVRGATAAAGVISAHVDTEGEHEICYVGRLLAFESDGFTLQEITPNAEWLTEPSFFGFDEVSAIAFGGPYSEMLAKVAGDPPPLKPQQRESLT